MRKRAAAVDRVSPADRPTGARHAATAQVAGFTSSSIVTLMHLAAASVVDPNDSALAESLLTQSGSPTAEAQGGQVCASRRALDAPPCVYLPAPSACLCT